MVREYKDPRHDYLYPVMAWATPDRIKTLNYDKFEGTRAAPHLIDDESNMRTPDPFGGEGGEAESFENDHWATRPNHDIDGTARKGNGSHMSPIVDMCDAWLLDNWITVAILFRSRGDYTDGATSKDTLGGSVETAWSIFANTARYHMHEANGSWGSDRAVDPWVVSLGTLGLSNTLGDSPFVGSLESSSPDGTALWN